MEQDLEREVGQEMLDVLFRIDKRNEIFNLWYEITYLRILFSRLVEDKPELSSILNQEVMDNARIQAQQIVKDRFPICMIDFPKKESV